MDVNQLYPSSDALKAEDLNGQEWTLTIESVDIREFDENGYKKHKPVIRFKETEKTFVCNKTNTITIADFCGQDTDHWPGRKVSLYPTKTDFGGKIVPCIRFRLPSNGQGAQPTTNQPLPGSEHPFAPAQENPPVGGAGAELDDEIPFAPETRG